MSIQVPFQKSRFHSSSVLPLFVLGTLLIQVLLLLMVFFQGSQLSSLANQPPPTLVQLVDGHVFQAKPAQTNYRSAEVIKQFINQWDTLTYTWSNLLPPTNEQEANKPPRDSGIVIERNKKLPTTAVNAAFLISDKNNFRLEFLRNLSSLVPPGVFAGSQQTVLRISDILPPKEMGQGRWDVDVYAYMQVLDVAQPVGTPIEVNQKFSLMAVPPPLHPIENGLTPLQQAIYRLGEAGLMIERIENLQT